MNQDEIFNKLLKSLRRVYKNKNKIYNIHSPIFTKEDKLKLNHCIDTTYVSSIGNLINNFEERLKRITKAKHVISLVNGTSALHIALKLIGVKKNDEILLPAFNFVASSNACLYLEAIPIYFDSDDKLGPDLDKIEDFLNKNTKIKNKRCFNLTSKRYISACIPTYSYGHNFDIKRLIKMCKKYQIKVVEDSSEGLGTKVGKKHVGTFGDIGVLSFNGNKIITTGGGGAIITNNSSYAKNARHITATSKVNLRFQTMHNEIGYNYRMPNLNAALGLSQINKLSFFLNEKRRLYNNLSKSLLNLKDYFEIFKEPNYGKSNYWIQLMVVKKNINIEKVLKFLNRNNIQAKKVWESNNSYNFLKKYPNFKLKKSYMFSKKIICLPSNNFKI